ncbi:MAG: DUF3105 domain-containing protein [Actinomycetota bacterium]
MAKKKRKKKRPDRPPARAAAATTTAGPRPEHTERSTSARAERKEQARRERERRIKQARRRQRTRRAVRWGVVLGAAAAIGTFVYVQVQEGRQLRDEAAAAASRIGCGPVQEPQDEGTQHLQPNDAPPTYGTIPATSGPHSGSPLPAEPAIYDQPVPEVNAVHNLEHGYVLIHYRADGDGALEQAAIDELEAVADGEAEIIMAPYPNLDEGTNLAFVAWTRLQTCEVQGGAEVDDVALAARGFIDEFKNGPAAPEAEVS